MNARAGVSPSRNTANLKDDPQYAAKAERISAPTRDPSELLPALLPELATKPQGRVNQPDTLYAYHPLCTLQHGQNCAAGGDAPEPVGFAAHRAQRRPPVLRLGGHILVLNPTCRTSCVTASSGCWRSLSATSRPT